MRFFLTFMSVAGLMAGGVLADATTLDAFALEDLPAKAVEASEWFIETVDDTRNVGAHLSVAYSDTSRRTFVSYYDGINGDLWIAWSLLPANQGLGDCGPDGNWACFAFDTGGDVGMYNAIDAVDFATKTSIAVSYYDATNKALKVLKGYIGHDVDIFGFNLYTIMTGDSESGERLGKHTSVVLDPVSDPTLDPSKFGNWQPIIAFQIERDSPVVDVMMVVRPVPENTGNCGEGDMLNDWQWTNIIGGYGLGQYTSIDINDSGNPSVAFYGGDGLHKPYFAEEVGSGGNCGSGSTWNCTSVPNGTDETGEFVSLALEGDGTPHMAYYNATDEALEYATLVGSGGNCGDSNSWNCSYIHAMGSSLSDMGISLDLTPGDYPAIAYQDASSLLGPSTLAIARPFALLPGSTPNCGPPSLLHDTWVCEWLDSGGATLSEARAVSLHVNKVGQAMVAYHELDDYPYPAEGKLKFTSEPRPLVFSDGFEDGHFDFWSAVVTGTAP